MEMIVNLFSYVPFQVVTSLLLCLICAAFVYVRHFHQKYDHIPGPPRASFWLGNLSDLAEERRAGVFFTHTLFKYIEEYGQTIKIFVLHQCLLVTADPESVKDLMVTGGHPKSDRSYKQVSNLFGKRFLGDGLVSATDNETWQWRRGLINPCFQRSYLSNLIEDFNLGGDSLMDRLTSVADGKTKVSMLAEFNHVTLDIISKAAFGIESNNVQQKSNPFNTAILTAFKGFDLSVTDPFAMFKPKNWKQIWEVRKALGFLRAFGVQMMQTRKTAMSKGEYVPDDILTHLIKIHEQNPEIEQEVMIDDFLTFFVAGQETTATMLSFMMLEVGKHPEILKRLQEEVDNVVGVKSVIPASDLPQLTYMDMVIRETLRLFPPAPLSFREVKQDTVVGSYMVPAGSHIALSNYIGGRLEAFFPEPLEFRPERFSPEAKRPSVYTYFPFAIGPRTCIGKNFALMEAKILMAKLLQRFDFEIDPDQSFDIVQMATLRPKGGSMCTLTPRLTN